MEVKYMYKGASHRDTISYLEKRLNEYTEAQNKVLDGTLHPVEVVGNYYHPNIQRDVALARLKMKIQEFTERKELAEGAE